MLMMLHSQTGSLVDTVACGKGFFKTLLKHHVLISPLLCVNPQHVTVHAGIEAAAW